MTTVWWLGLTGGDVGYAKHLQRLRVSVETVHQLWTGTVQKQPQYSIQASGCGHMRSSGQSCCKWWPLIQVPVVPLDRFWKRVRSGSSTPKCVNMRFLRIGAHPKIENGGKQWLHWNPTKLHFGKIQHIIVVIWKLSKQRALLFLVVSLSVNTLYNENKRGVVKIIVNKEQIIYFIVYDK